MGINYRAKEENFLVEFHKKYTKASLGIALTLIFGCGFLVVSKLNPTLDAELKKPLPQDPAVQVYFNHNPATSYKDPYRGFIREGDNLEDQIINAIANAKTSVAVAVMEFRLPRVAQAMVYAQQRGVRVRLLIDHKYNETLAEMEEALAQGKKFNAHDLTALEELRRYPSDALEMVRTGGVEIKDDAWPGGQGSGLMHEKFVVVDGANTIISSGNFTISDMHGKLDPGKKDSRGNPNNMVVVNNNSEVAKVFEDEFNLMFDQGLFKAHKPQREPVLLPVGGGTIKFHFSPAKKHQDISTTSNGAIADYMQHAQKSIHVALFAFSAQNISDAMGEVHDKGVEVKELIDPDFYSTPYSKAWDAAGVCPVRTGRTKKVKVHPWHQPITTVGFPTGPLGDRGVHSKMGVIDGHIVLTGSHNWSNSGNYSNDETLLAINNPTVAAHYEREHKRLYAGAVLGLKSLPGSRPCDVDRTTEASTEPPPSSEPDREPTN